MKKIIIIGGGIAGLSAGIFAQMNGFESEIYEKNPVAGGQCMGWNRKGHHIDNCIHWLTGTKRGTDLYKLWEVLGAVNDNTEMIALDKFYTAESAGQSATLWRDLDKTQKELIKVSPEDKEEIVRFINAVKSSECCEVPVKKPMYMMGIKDYIELGKSMAGMMPVMKEYGAISLEDFAGRFKSELLKKLFTDYLPKEYIASSFIVSYATMVSGSGDIPKNGSLAMVNRIVDRYRSVGGILHTGKAVKRINAADGGGRAAGITLEDGSVIMADYIISAADTSETFYKLLDERFRNKAFAMCYENRKDYPVFTAFQAAFSIDSGIADVDKHDVTFFDCKPFFVGSKKVERMSIKNYYYEASFAPKGKTVLQTNVMQMEDDYDYWKSLSPEEYKAAKIKLADDIMERVTDRFPQLRSSIELLDCWTPLTYTRYCNSFHGAYMGFITKKGIKKPKVKAPIKGLSNVFVASQWLQSPGGLPTAAASGKFAIQHILKKEKKSIEI